MGAGQGRGSGGGQDAVQEGVDGPVAGPGDLQVEMLEDVAAAGVDGDFGAVVMEGPGLLFHSPVWQVGVRETRKTGAPKREPRSGSGR